MGRVTLADSSVWIDYLRQAGTRADVALDELRSTAPGDLVMTAPVAMELLFGPTDELSVRRVENLVDGLPSLAVDPDDDFRAAAQIYRAVRRNGRTIRKATDCLIAAIAIRHKALVLHKDADFDAIAEVTALEHRSLRDP